jgi:hypothetical protein
MDALTIYSLNVKGGLSKNKAYKLVNDFRQGGWEIILLQEVPRITAHTVDLIDKELNAKIYLRELKKGTHNLGVACIISNKVVNSLVSVENITTIGEGRLQLI